MRSLKNRKKSGETLVETLAAILVIALASAMFFTSAIASSKINSKVAKADETYRTKVDTAEKEAGTRNGAVTIKTDSGNFNYDVIYSGESDSPVSYKLKEGSP